MNTTVIRKISIEFSLHSNSWRLHNQKEPHVSDQNCNRKFSMEFCNSRQRVGNVDQLFLHPPINLKLIDFELLKNLYLVRNTQVLLSLSFLEGGPQTILEALALGTPVVATDTSFAADFLTGENGVLLPNEPSPKLIRIAIQKALDIKNLGSQWNLLLRDFSWKKLSQKLFP